MELFLVHKLITWFDFVLDQVKTKINLTSNSIGPQFSRKCVFPLFILVCISKGMILFLSPTIFKEHTVIQKPLL